ncbi:hypothetical protein [Loktanella salsilacus]|uniref:hypothetical protein n=1 Tax=Loktanella salsilacus TaxID=195913 RepID=UPI003703F3C4
MDVVNRVAQIKIFDNALRLKEARAALEVGYADKAAVGGKLCNVCFKLEDLQRTTSKQN